EAVRCKCWFGSDRTPRLHPVAGQKPRPSLRPHGLRATANTTGAGIAIPLSVAYALAPSIIAYSILRRCSALCIDSIGPRRAVLATTSGTTASGAAKGHTSGSSVTASTVKPAVRKALSHSAGSPKRNGGGAGGR